MMKVFVFLFCLLAAAAANEEWENFKTLYGRSYVNVQEERYRQSVFHRNQKKIDEHNERFKNGLVTFDLKMNRFGDMTQAEISATMTGRRKLENIPSPELNYQPAKPLLAEVDWRDKGAVTPVKDQGACESCWSFSATGALEGQHFLATGELVSLSEQNLMDCSWDYGNFGCFGGLEYEGWKYVSDNGGLDTEEFYPYEAKDKLCRYDEEGVGATCKGPKHIKSGSEVALQEAVQDIGPISVGIDASFDSFSFYSSGVYYEPKCSTENLDHSVLAVGYGEDVNGDEYWIVKNSWDSSWGEDGYIKMARNINNNCGIATDASYPLV